MGDSLMLLFSYTTETPCCITICKVFFSKIWMLEVHCPFIRQPSSDQYRLLVTGQPHCSCNSVQCATIHKFYISKHYCCTWYCLYLTLILIYFNQESVENSSHVFFIELFSLELLKYSGLYAQQPMFPNKKQFDMN